METCATVKNQLKVICKVGIENKGFTRRKGSIGRFKAEASSSALIKDCLPTSGDTKVWGNASIRTQEY